jgi:hypothetical protein
MRAYNHAATPCLYRKEARDLHVTMVVAVTGVLFFSAAVIVTLYRAAQQESRAHSKITKKTKGDAQIDGTNYEDEQALQRPQHTTENAKENKKESKRKKKNKIT